MGRHSQDPEMLQTMSLDKQSSFVHIDSWQEFKIDIDQLITRETGIQETQMPRVITTMDKDNKQVSAEHLYNEEKSTEMKAPNLHKIAKLTQIYCKIAIFNAILYFLLKCKHLF